MADSLKLSKEVVERECALEYELARSTKEVIDGLTESNSLTDFAIFLKKTAPQFPSAAWWELTEESRNSFMNPVGTSGHFRPPASQAELYLPTRENLEQVEFWNPAQPKYLIDAILALNLNDNTDSILKRIAPQIDALRAMVKNDLIKLFGTPKYLKKHKIPDDQIAIPTCEQKKVKGKGARIRLAKDNLGALQQLKVALIAKPSEMYFEPKTLGDWTSKVLSLYYRFAFCWVGLGTSRHYSLAVQTYTYPKAILAQNPCKFSNSTLIKQLFSESRFPEKLLLGLPKGPKPRKRYEMLKSVMTVIKH